MPLKKRQQLGSPLAFILIMVPHKNFMSNMATYPMAMAPPTTMTLLRQAKSIHWMITWCYGF